jgi:DNA-binding transcriptional MerR regulator
MKPSQLAVAIYAVLTFASGALVGVVGHRLYSASDVRAKSSPPRTPEDYRRRYVDEMRTRLKLSDSQLTDLNVILDSTRDRFRQLREKERPEVKIIQDEQVQRIRAMLDTTQRAEYEKMREEREKRMRERKDKEGHEKR